MSAKKTIAEIMGKPDPHLEIKAPRCPLCHVLMLREERAKAKCWVFCCRAPEHGYIAIKVDDPFVNRWEEALKEEKILCVNPRCPKAPLGEMRYFATRTGYMKAACPADNGGCGALLTNGMPDRKKDEVYTPENKGTLQ